MWVYVPILVILCRSRQRRHFRPFSNVDYFRPKDGSDVISGAFMESTGVTDPVKFGDSGSKGSRDIRLPQFVTNDDDNNDNAGVRTVCSGGGGHRR